MSIVIIGMPASGKTTVGAAVAERLDLRQIDTDTLVEAKTGLLIREIFATQGEQRFRELEAAATEEALRGPGPAVVTLGGGAIMTPRVRELIAPHDVVWLDVSVRVLTRRAGMTQVRPLLLGDVRRQLETLAGARRPLYRAAADLRIDADHTSVSATADIICTFWKERHRER